MMNPALLTKLTRLSLGAAMFVGLGATTCNNTPPGAICGNGIIEDAEACDDGNTINGDGCESDCTVAVGPDCGDGVLDAGEQCDDANQSNTDACTNDCENAICGDGFILTGVEACDDGNTINGDGCESDCTITVGPDCGDGNLDAGEQCDDGNLLNTDDCTAACLFGICGDGFVIAGIEACDDANNTNGDGCDNNCSVTACGNGIITGVEACDDGNNNNGDGCEGDCTIALSSPSLAAINPNNSLSGFDTADVVLDGAGFAPDAVVTVAGVSVPTSSCDYTGTPTQIVCTIPASNNVVRGDVTVTNPDNQSTTLANAWTFTGVVTDADFCNVQFPKDLINAPGTTPVAVNTQVLIFGQLFEGGLTDANATPAPGVIGDFGLSSLNPTGADLDPTASTTWRFRPAQPNGNFNFVQNNDEYFIGFVPNTIGFFRYGFRFSFDGGLNFTYCDKDDTNNGFNAAQISQMEVIQ